MKTFADAVKDYARQAVTEVLRRECHRTALKLDVLPEEVTDLHGRHLSLEWRPDGSCVTEARARFYPDQSGALAGWLDVYWVKGYAFPLPLNYYRFVGVGEDERPAQVATATQLPLRSGATDAVTTAGDAVYG